MALPLHVDRCSGTFPILRWALIIICAFSYFIVFRLVYSLVFGSCWRKKGTAEIVLQKFAAFWSVLVSNT